MPQYNLDEKGTFETCEFGDYGLSDPNYELDLDYRQS